MSDSTKPAASMEMSQSAKYYTLAILTIVYVFNFIDRQILVILQPLIKADLDLSDTQLGLLSGIAFAFFYTVLGIPIARLADRSNRRNIIAVALTAWSAMTVVCGYTQNYIQLLLARMGVGVGEAGGSPPAHSMISDMFTEEKRATALAIYSAGLYLGVLIGFSAGGYFGETFGWRQTFLIVGAPGLLLAIILYLTVREPARTQPVKSADAPSFRDTMNRLMKLKSFPFFAIGCGMSAFVSYGTSNFMPSYMVRYHEVPLSEIGFLLAITGGGGGIIGTFLGGYLTDRIGGQDPRWYLWLPGLTAVTAVPLAIYVFNTDNTTMMLWAYFVVAVLGTLYLAPSIAVAHRLVDPRMRAMTSAILFFVLNMIGLGGGPVIVGMISDFFTNLNGQDGLRIALTIGGCVALIKGYLFWSAGLKLPADLKVAAELNNASKE
ncbi:MAG: MFS transporter [Kordiimonadaceae bacterium]|nr:MFS transporter [Kordiimonadaceae bacterium]MBO6567244.1 MFS transporter [Kordiimonadaceae bacterium]MBO6963542.1 MFS transporter [Kordiimonadaceae bacterium]